MPLNTAGGSGTLDASLNTIITEFKLLSQERGTIRQTATQYTLEPHSGASKVVLNYGRVVAYGVAEGVDVVQAQALADTQTAYTPSEVAVQVLVSDRTIDRVADPALMRQVGRMMSNAYELKEDGDGAAQYSSFTATLGSSGVVATVGHTQAARAILRIGNSVATPEPAPAPFYAGFHPNSLAPITARLIPLAAGPGATTLGAAGVMGAAPAGPVPEGPSADALRSGKFPGMLSGFTFVDSANVAISGTDAINAFYSKEGLIYVSELEPTEERERDASLRATEINIVGSYAFGVYRPAAYGIKATFDATTPTS
jgi:hypothetical protein